MDGEGVKGGRGGCRWKRREDEGEGVSLAGGRAKKRVKAEGEDACGRGGRVNERT